MEVHVFDLTWTSSSTPEEGRARKPLMPMLKRLRSARNFHQSRFKGSLTIQMAMRQPKRL